MLTRLFPAPFLGARPLMRGVALAVLLAVPAAVEPAFAGSGSLACVRSRGILACASQWNLNGNPPVQAAPAARDPREDAEAAERERRWVARCRPVIRQDQYGVPRYHYAAPGCEYGVIHD
jgi:hypothetical protein